MKKLVICLFLMILAIPVFSQATKKHVSKTKSAKQTIVYKDENGEIIGKDDFDERSYDESLTESSYEKIYKNGKLIELKLKKNLRENQPLNDFKATTFDGKTIDTKQLKGKVLVINFWFIACSGCIAEFPILNKIKARFKDNPDVVFMAPTWDESARLKSFLRKKKFDYQIIPDAQKLYDDVFKYNGSFPTNIIVSKDGIITRWQSGVYLPEKFAERIQTELEKEFKSGSTNP